MVMEEQPSDMELDSERVPVPRVQQQGQRSENEERPEAVEDTGISRRKPRLRKKALHAAILRQMEFYFSDANLRKDRFLSSLIREDEPYVDLNVFLTFNKIKELTTDVDRIAKALRGSEMLSLSEDGTKVRRVTPIVRREKEDADDCTVYVQNLPLDADHETLRSMFSPYGPVVYVSIPRFKNNTRKIKGFAFVEFDAPESAEKCLKAFRKKGCILPSHTAPDELLSISTFDEPEKDVAKRIRVNGSQEENRTENLREDDGGDKRNGEERKETETSGDNRNNGCIEEKRSNKRKHEGPAAEFLESTEEEKQRESESISKKMKSKRANVEDDEIDKKKEDETSTSVDSRNKEKKSKKRKHEDSAAEFSESTEEQEKESIKKRKDEVCLNTIEASNDREEPMATDDDDTAPEQENAGEQKKKKRKKRKRRSKTEEFCGQSIGLQVMAKRDWKRLRNKYLELQRNKMKQLKQHLRKSRWNQWSNREQNKVEKEEGEEKDKKATVPRFSFTPGVIVKIEMEKPCTDPKSLKVELRNKNNSVKYIDVEEGSCLAHARFDTNEAARALVRRFNEEEEERRMTILEGEEEKVYWEKILSDREEKLTKKVRPKERGRNKLLKRAEKELGKHIKFDEV